MQIAKLGRAAEQRLVDALDTAAIHMEDGEHPTDAVYKAASRHRVPAGHIHLMTNAVNTGRTNSHRREADDLFAKAAEFPLASTHDVLQRLYPDTVKTAEVVKHDNDVSQLYSRRPVIPEAAPVMIKTAAANRSKSASTTHVVPYQADDSDAGLRLVGLIKRAENEVEVARCDQSAALDICVKKASEIVDYFRRPGSLAFADVNYNVRELFGTDGSRVMDTLANALPTSMVKRASSKLHPVLMHQQPYSMIRSLLNAQNTFLAKCAAYHEACAHFEAVREESLLPFDETRLRMKGHISLAGLSSMDLNEKTAAISFSSMLGTGMAAMNARGMGMGVSRYSPFYYEEKQKKEREYLSKLMDPAHESEIRNIQAEAMLNNLMANDDVIKGHHPDDVMDAYNEISQLAPHAATQTALVRDLMRKRLSGGPGAIDSFAIDSLVNTNNKIKQREDMNQANINALQGYGVMPNVPSAAPAAAPPKTASVLDFENDIF